MSISAIAGRISENSAGNGRRESKTRGHGSPVPLKHLVAPMSSGRIALGKTPCSFTACIVSSRLGKMRVIARSGGYISRKFTPCRSGRRIRSFSRVIAPFPVERPDVAVSVSGADSARWRLPRMARHKVTGTEQRLSRDERLSPGKRY